MLINPEIFRNNVKTLRLRRGWTLQQLGERMSTTKSTIHDLENKSTNPTLATVYKLALIFEITVDRLIHVEMFNALYDVDAVFIDHYKSLDSASRLLVRDFINILKQHKFIKEVL